MYTVLRKCVMRKLSSAIFSGSCSIRSREFTALSGHVIAYLIVCSFDNLSTKSKHTKPMPTANVITHYYIHHSLVDSYIHLFAGSFLFLTSFALRIRETT